MHAKKSRTQQQTASVMLSMPRTQLYLIRRNWAIASLCCRCAERIGPLQMFPTIMGTDFPLACQDVLQSVEPSSLKIS